MNKELVLGVAMIGISLYMLYVATKDPPCDQCIIGPPKCGIGEKTTVPISNQCCFVGLENTGTVSQQRMDLYYKIIVSESEYGTAMKRNDIDGMKKALDETCRLQKELEELIKKENEEIVKDT